MRRRLLVVLVATMLLLSGCASVQPANDTATETPTPTDTDEQSPADDETETNDTTDNTSGATPTDENATLEIHHFDVGQADATLVVTPTNETILIDTGDWRQDGAEIVASLKKHDITHIDHLVATHGHADHIGGHAAVIEYVEEHGGGVGAAYDSGVPHTSQTYENYLDAIEAFDVQLFEVQEGDELPVDGVTATILNPPAGETDGDLDANSVALTLEYGNVTYLTTGDAGRDAEQRMLEAWGDALDADVYQAGHHGSSTSSSAPFLAAVNPSIAVISSARDSQYGHPHDEVLERFAEDDIETYWTGVHGTIVITTDGSEIMVETTTDFSSDPEDLLAEKPEDESAALPNPTVDGTDPPTPA